MDKKWSEWATKSTVPEVIKNASEACFPPTRRPRQAPSGAQQRDRGFQRLPALRCLNGGFVEKTRPWAWRDEIPPRACSTELAVPQQTMAPQASSSWMHCCVTAGSALTMKNRSTQYAHFSLRDGLATTLPRQQLPQLSALRREPGAQPLSTLPPGTASPVRHAARIQKLQGAWAHGVPGYKQEPVLERTSSPYQLTIKARPVQVRHSQIADDQVIPLHFRRRKASRLSSRVSTPCPISTSRRKSVCDTVGSSSTTRIFFGGRDAIRPGCGMGTTATS